MRHRGWTRANVSILTRRKLVIRVAGAGGVARSISPGGDAPPESWQPVEGRHCIRGLRKRREYPPDRTPFFHTIQVISIYKYMYMFWNVVSKTTARCQQWWRYFFKNCLINFTSFFSSLGRFGLIFGDFQQRKERRQAETMIDLGNASDVESVSPVTLSSDWSRVARLLLLASLAVIGSVGNVFMISAVMIEDHLKKRGELFSFRNSKSRGVRKNIFE